jgi:hypothetical protein
MVGAAMMTESDRRAVALYPELRKIVDIRGIGWVFQLATDDDGEITAVKGMFLHRVGMAYWADMLQIRDSADAAAVRLNPDRLPVWQVTGTMVDAIDGLAQLPPPASPSAPRLVIGGVGLWVPNGE